VASILIHFALGFFAVGVCGLGVALVAGLMYLVATAIPDPFDYPEEPKESRE
jgi:hypothetical protein